MGVESPTITAEYMRKQLQLWHPEWDKKTIQSWKGKQLYAIYRKEEQEMVKKVEERIRNPKPRYTQLRFL